MYNFRFNDVCCLPTGGAYSGKSTFVKQLRIHYGDGFPDEERAQFRNQVHDNITAAAHKIIEHMKETGIPFADESLQVGVAKCVF